jgi:uncharacterized protein YaiL (DUF2058 family)
MMADSLREQLLALGLAKASASGARRKSNADPHRKIEQQRRQRTKRKEDKSKSQSTSAAESELSLEQAYRQREEQAKKQVEHARELKRIEDRRRRKLNDNIRAIVKPHRLNDPAAEISRNFMYKGRIRKVNVTAGQLTALNEGALGLVYLAGGYHILQPEYVEQVRCLSAEHVPDLMSSVDEDDEYPVPDDLHW